MARSTAITLPDLVCLGCGLRLEPAKIHDGEGVYLPAPPEWHSPRFLDVRGQTCRECETALDEMDPRQALVVFETRLEALMAKTNPEAHRICVALRAKSHPDIEGQRPSVRVRMDRAELEIKGQHEFHSWRQASYAWHARTYGTARAYADDGSDIRFGWITESYLFPAVTRPLEQRFIDLGQLPHYPDGSQYAGPEDPKERKAWLEEKGAYAWRTLEEVRLVV